MLTAAGDFFPRFIDGTSMGWVLVNNDFSASDLKPWSMLLRNLDPFRLFMFVFEDEKAALREQAIMPKHLGLKCECVNASNLKLYQDLMKPVMHFEIIIILRSSGGNFASMLQLPR